MKMMWFSSIILFLLIKAKRWKRKKRNGKKKRNEKRNKTKTKLVLNDEDDVVLIVIMLFLPTRCLAVMTAATAHSKMTCVVRRFIVIPSHARPIFNQYIAEGICDPGLYSSLSHSLGF